MIFFQSIQIHFKVLGISAKQSRERSPFCTKHLMIILILSVAVSAQTKCIISLAETFEEYTTCIYGIFTLIMYGIEFGIHIWKMKQIFKFIENFKHLIESSELNQK